MSDSSRVGGIVASKYRLEEELGRGGMGAVYRARHVGVHKDFAVKLLLGDLVSRRSIVQRFFLEAQAAGRIGHAGILDVYDVGEDPDGTPFIVMELLTGEPLSVLIRRGPLDVDAACWITMQVLDVLAAAHQAGIIHRDVKPQNVFVTERPASSSPSGSGAAVRGVKLLDFGIAKFTGADGVASLTSSGEIIGSPLYMAPEQAKGESDVDARADVWSVGAMLFEMLTGKCAHAATTPVAVLAKILTEPAPPPGSRRDGIPPEVDAVVGRALEIDRARRFPSARAMYDELVDVRRRLGTADTVPALPRPSPRVSFQPPSAMSRTPDAIASTIGAQASSTATALADGEPAPKAAASSAVAELPTRRRAVTAGAGLVLAIGLFVAYLRLEGDRRPADARPAPSTITAASAPPLASAAPAAEPIVEAGSVASTADAAPPTSATAPPPPAARAAPPPTRCEPGEVLSKGHCCPRGFEWQDGRCERPLATTF